MVGQINNVTISNNNIIRKQDECRIKHGENTLQLHNRSSDDRSTVFTPPMTE